MIYLLIISLLLVVVSVLIIILIIKRSTKRMDHRAEERLKLDKENTSAQQQKIKSMNERLTKIESILKEVD